MTEWTGYKRPDGRIGIRNNLLVVYLVECSKFVAEKISQNFDHNVQVVGFGGCYPNEHAHRVLTQICTHPNVGACLLISLGCECYNRQDLESAINNSGRPVKTLVIQESGGTKKSIEEGRAWVSKTVKDLEQQPKVSMQIKDLVIGTICGGSDGTSGISANPAVGVAFDKLIEEGAIAMFEETGELIGCEEALYKRASDKDVRAQLQESMIKAASYYKTMGHGSFSVGNAEGGLTTQEEKSLGAYCKSGSSPISGVIKPGQVPDRSGLYLLDVVSDGEVRFGFPNINDSSEITELIACGCHLILFTTGKGSVVGSAVSPVVKVCANPETFRKMSDDMDVNAGRFLEENCSIEDIGNEIFEKVLSVSSGSPSLSEELGHQEFVLLYKQFDLQSQPSCHPAS